VADSCELTRESHARPPETPSRKLAGRGAGAVAREPQSRGFGQPSTPRDATAIIREDLTGDVTEEGWTAGPGSRRQAP